MNRTADAPAGNHLTNALRYLAFAAIVASMVGVYTAVVGPSLGRFRLESTDKLLIPLVVIAGLVALPVYAALCRDRRRLPQIVNLYGGFVLTCLAYGGFIWAAAPDGGPVFLVTALVAGHVLGTPLLLVLVGVHLVLERVGFYGG